MDDRESPLFNKSVFLAQVLSVSIIWVLVAVIIVWILGLISLSLELQDVPGASVGISLIAIPVFILIASVLTYVFIGMQRDKDHLSSHEEEK